MAVDGLGGVIYRSRCRRAVLYIVSEVRAQTGSRFEKPEVVFLVQEMDRNAQICVTAGLWQGRMLVLAAFQTAGPPRVISSVGSRTGSASSRPAVVCQRLRAGRHVPDLHRDAADQVAGADFRHTSRAARAAATPVCMGPRLALSGGPTATAGPGLRSGGPDSAWGHRRSPCV